MTPKVLTVSIGATLSLATSVRAHHSWSVDYDTRQTIVVAGAVSEYLGRRPHSAMTIDVETVDGGKEQWTVEWSRGFRDSDGREYGPELMVPGEAITVTGQPHRTDATLVRMRSVVRNSDGESFETGRPRDGRRDGRGRGRDRGRGGNRGRNSF